MHISSFLINKLIKMKIKSLSETINKRNKLILFNEGDT